MFWNGFFGFNSERATVNSVLLNLDNCKILAILKLAFLKENLTTLEFLHHFIDQNFSTFSKEQQDFIMQVTLTKKQTKAFLNLKRKNYQYVIELLSQRQFDQKYHEYLQKMWYEAHYIAYECDKNAAAQSVDKFRIRRRNPLPMTIWNGEKIIYCFTEKATNILNSAYEANKYPNNAEKNEICQLTKLPFKKISNWFKNKRQREKMASKKTKQKK